MGTLVPADLSGHLRFVLAQIEAEAVAQNAEPLPERRFTTLGGAVLDCAQVSVSALTATLGPSNNLEVIAGLTDCPPGWVINGEAVIVRCSHEQVQTRRGGGVEAPTVDQIEADTVRASADAAVLTSVIENLAGEFGSPSIELQFGQPQGGLLAVVATFSLNTWLPEPVPETPIPV